MNIPSRFLRIAYSALRLTLPTLKLGNTVVISRYDHVKEILSNGYLYRAPYLANLKTVTGSTEDFLLGMEPGQDYDRQRKMLAEHVRDKDVTDLIPNLASEEVDKLIGNGGEIDVVAIVRRATSRTLLSYFGMGENLSDEQLSEYENLALEIFKYQFMDDGIDAKKREVARSQGQRLVTLISEQISLLKQSGLSDDNLLQRYLLATNSNDALSEELIVMAIFGFIVGGLPQPPMVVPNALNELMNKPNALKMAIDAARTSDAQLQAIFFEALRFDPLAPMLKRTVVEDTVLAAGTKRERKLAKNNQLIVLFASAMQDHRRLSKPGKFIPNRPKSAYMHFGFDHHECFAAAINRRMLPAMLKPLLLRDALTRVDGKRGKLVKADIAFPQRFYLQVA